MNKKVMFTYFIIVAGFLLLILNLSEFDCNNYKNNNYFGVVSNFLLIIAMVINIKALNKEKKSKYE